MTAPAYRSDPRWQEAHARLLDDSGNDGEVMVRAVRAACALYDIEHEYALREDPDHVC